MTRKQRIVTPPPVTTQPHHPADMFMYIIIASVLIGVAGAIVYFLVFAPKDDENSSAPTVQEVDNTTTSAAIGGDKNTTDDASDLGVGAIVGIVAAILVILGGLVTVYLRYRRSEGYEDYLLKLPGGGEDDDNKEKTPDPTKNTNESSNKWPKVEMPYLDRKNTKATNKNSTTTIAPPDIDRVIEEYEKTIKNIKKKKVPEEAGVFQTQMEGLDILTNIENMFEIKLIGMVQSGKDVPSYKNKEYYIKKLNDMISKSNKRNISFFDQDYKEKVAEVMELHDKLHQEATDEYGTPDVRLKHRL